MNDAVGQGRFAMVDVGDDGKIADMVHAVRIKRAPAAPWRIQQTRDFSGFPPNIHALLALVQEVMAQLPAAGAAIPVPVRHIASRTGSASTSTTSKPRPNSSASGCHRHLHVMAEMAVASTEQGQWRTRFNSTAESLDGDKGLTLPRRIRSVTLEVLSNGPRAC